MNLSIRNFDFCYKYLYWIISASFLASMFILGLPRVLINGILIFAIGIRIIQNNNVVFIGSEITIFLYLSYCSISSVISFINGYPVYGLLSTLVGSFLPGLLAFNREKESIESFYEKTYTILTLVFVISLILHFSVPRFYREYLLNEGYTSSNTVFDAQYFVQGIFGVTVLGTLSSCSSLFFLCKLFDTPSTTTAASMGISIMTLFITTRRSAIASFLIGALFIALIKSFAHLKNNNLLISQKKIIFFETTILILTIVVIKNFSFLFNLLSRVSNVSRAIGERNNEWIENINSLAPIQFIFGSGYGIRSHVALRYGFMAVSDSSFVEILCELGVIGSILFAVIILLFIYNLDFKNTDLYYLSSELTVFVFLIQSIGSNVLEFQATATLFWVALGYCLHNHYWDMLAACKETGNI